MKKIFLIFIALFLLNSSCSKSIIIFPELSYNKYDKEIDELYKLYQNIPMNRSTSIKNFVTDAKLIEYSDSLKNTDVTAVSVFQVFVDEYGSVESIFKLHNATNFLDSLAVEAIKKSKFKSLNWNSSKTKYSFFISYPFFLGVPDSPYINGISTNTRKNSLKSARVFSGNLYAVYEVSEPPFLLEAESLKLTEIDLRDNLWPSSYFYCRTTIEFTIDESGSTIDFHCVDSTNDKIVDIIREHVSTRKYKPGIKDGNPVKVRIREIYKFETKYF